MNRRIWVLALALVALVSVSCEEVVVGYAKDPVSPEIVSFSVSPGSVLIGEATEVTWAWTYSNSPTPVPSCNINQGVGVVANGESTSINITADTTYALTCTNSAGSDTAQKTVTVVASAVAPDIATFSATPSSV